jgi:hypothetical protein
MSPYFIAGDSQEITCREAMLWHPERLIFVALTPRQDQRGDGTNSISRMLQSYEASLGLKERQRRFYRPHGPRLGWCCAARTFKLWVWISLGVSSRLTCCVVLCGIALLHVQEVTKDSLPSDVRRQQWRCYIWQAEFQQTKEERNGVAIEQEKCKLSSSIIRYFKNSKGYTAA